MLHRAILLSAALTLTPALAWAQSQTDRLLDALGLYEIVDIMRDEGLTYSVTLAEEMLPDGNSTAWQRKMQAIYDREAMAETVRLGIEKALDGNDIEPIIAFFESDDGRTIIQLELSARRAMVEEAIEEAARDRYRDLEADGDPALDAVSRFIAANDLIEQNVTGALNSNVMFYRGMVDGGTMAMSEDMILAEVWGQEAETREETREWLYAFLLMAYQPLDPGLLERYIALSETRQGRLLNRALFAGFDEMYAQVSYALGLAIAGTMQSQEL